MKINFEVITRLKFQKAIKINNKLLFRASEYPDYNYKNKIVDYLFYNKWEKGLLPKPTHKIILYFESRKEKVSDGWFRHRILKFTKGVLINLENNEREKIKSIDII